ncbi:MAG TPA: DinB family protein, partial [Pirellulales bacterium]
MSAAATATKTAAGNQTAKQMAFADLERELAITRKVLERIPQEHFAWKPHEKSMALGRLAMHVATMPQWMLSTLEKDELDMANPPKIKTEPESQADLLKIFDEHAAAVRQAMDRIDDAGLERPWSLKQGQQVLHSKSKAQILRV